MLRDVPIVDSSHITAVQYDDETMDLIVQFKRGGLYRYKNVPGDIPAGLQQALSAGQYFHQFIRSEFNFERLS